jgi:hypothetical protein
MRNRFGSNIETGHFYPDLTEIINCSDNYSGAGSFIDGGTLNNMGRPVAQSG